MSTMNGEENLLFTKRNIHKGDPQKTNKLIIVKVASTMGNRNYILKEFCLFY